MWKHILFENTLMAQRAFQPYLQLAVMPQQGINSVFAGNTFITHV